jgi:hypothetical protein
MEQDGRSSRNLGYKLDAATIPDNQTGRGTSIYPTLNTNVRSINELVSEPSMFGSGQGRTTTDCAVQNVDGEGTLQTLPSGNHGHSHVAPPTSFSRKKVDFRGFR